MNGVAERQMAKRNDTAVKLDVEVVTTAKMVAASRGVPLAEYLSELLRPIVGRELDAEVAKRSKAKPPKGKA